MSQKTNAVDGILSQKLLILGHICWKILALPRKWDEKNRQYRYSRKKTSLYNNSILEFLMNRNFVCVGDVGIPAPKTYIVAWTAVTS